MIWLVVICPNTDSGHFPIRPIPRQDTDTVFLSGYRATSRGIRNTDCAPETQAHGLPNFCFPQRDPWPACTSSCTPLHPTLLHTELLHEGSETLPNPCEGFADTTSSQPRSFWFSVPRHSSLPLPCPSFMPHPSSSHGQLILTKLFPVWHG